jgi:hypothetical protein
LGQTSFSPISVCAKPNNGVACASDSGDPIAFGERTIAFYAERGIDPLSKTIVYSDGLDMAMILRIQEHFAGRIRLAYGWGTNLTNDAAHPAQYCDENQDYALKVNLPSNSATMWANIPVMPPKSPPISSFLWCKSQRLTV